MGYDITTREIGYIIREYSRKSSECLYDYYAYMQVMYSTKMKFIKDQVTSGNQNILILLRSSWKKLQRSVDTSVLARVYVKKKIDLVQVL